MRAQLTSLLGDILSRGTQADLRHAIASAIGGTSNNIKGVSTLGFSAERVYNQTQLQQVTDNLDALMNSVRR